MTMGEVFKLRSPVAVDEHSPARALKQKLAGLPILRDLGSAGLDLLIPELEWICVPGGWVLFREREPGDSVYIVLAGRVGVVTADAEGRETIVNQIGVGETVGEMAILSGEPRSATVVAMRDCELVRLSKTSFDRIADEDPRVMRFITRTLVKRLDETTHRIVAQCGCTTIAVVPLSAEIDAAEFTRSLARTLRENNVRAMVADGGETERPTEWFNRIEEDHDVVLYQADIDPTEWTRLCVRQADRILLLASASHPTDRVAPALRVMPVDARGEQVEMVFLHSRGATLTVEIAEMLARYKVGFHYHMRIGHPGDIARLGRLISGRAVGMVFSGGGARGFAHLGAIRAFRDAGIPIDMFGGVSMGALVAAAAALEWDEDEILDHMRRAFVLTNPLSDYTLPLVAIVRGRKVSRLLREHFDSRLIEDCWRPMFCTSSNLTSGEMKVHRTGPIWRAIRAGIAIPGVLPPVIENNQILIDGGVMNNLPVDVMSAMRRGRVVGVDVAREHVLVAEADDLEDRPLWRMLRARSRGTPNIIGLLMSAGTINSEAQLKLRRQQVDVLVEPRLNSVGILDWRSYQTAINQGYVDTLEALSAHGDRLKFK
jgi:NTE family protein